MSRNLRQKTPPPSGRRGWGEKIKSGGVQLLNEVAGVEPWRLSGLTTEFVIGSGASEISFCHYFLNSLAGPEDILDRDNNVVRGHTILWLPERNVREKCDKP